MFATADAMIAGVIFLIVVIGLLMMRRVKKDMVEPIAQSRGPRIFIFRSGPGLPSGRRLIGAPPDDSEDVVEGQYRVL
jgi:hypothetical protein